MISLLGIAVKVTGAKIPGLNLEVKINMMQLVITVELVRFPNPLAFGSGLGERTPKKAIFQLRRPVV